MNPEQALQILEQATGLAPLTRQAHHQVIEAIKVLQEATKPKEKPTSKK